MQSTMAEHDRTLTSKQPDEQGLCLLSLDGGGVRGLSSLYILRDLMASVNKKAKNDPPVKPCEYFDMICGTSTGGIIAIMLGRLRMDVQECIDLYLELADKVFSRVHILPIDLRGRTHGRYNQEALRDAIKNLLISKQMSQDTLLKDQDPLSCKVFVCSKRLNTDSLVALTSYETRRVDKDLYDNITITQACLATSAAPTYFEPLEITLGPHTARYTASFIDGGLGYNNPIGQLWIQAGHIFDGPLKGKVQCLISIGTGEPVIPDYDIGAKDLFKRLQKIATNSREIAEDFYEAHRYDLGRARYFRFNVEQGLEKVDLGEVQQKARIIEVTKIYLGKGRVFDELEDCTEKLATRKLHMGFGLLLPCLQRLAQVYESEIQLLASKMEKDTARENLAWLINTRLFAAWMTPARGDVICSRWLRYPRTVSKEFVSSFIVYFQSIKYDALYIDCSSYKAVLQPFASKLLAHGRKTKETVKLLLFALICQGYNSVNLQDKSVGDFILKTLNRDLNLSDEDYLSQLRKCLCSSLDIQLPRNVVVLINNSHTLSSSDLELFRNQFQDVMDSKRMDGVAQTRAFVTGNLSYGADVALKGAMPVDEGTEYQECLQSLKFTAMNLRRNRIALVDLPDDHWLWSHEAYCTWMEESAGVLWVSGKPGSGKSVLARSIQRKFLETLGQRDKRSSLPIFCNWFYSARDRLTSHEQMMRVILLQILEQESLLFTYIVQHYRRLSNGEKMVEWTTAALEKCIVELSIVHRSPRTILCVIDGMDESEENARSELQLSRDSALSLLERLTTSFKVLILSRYHPSIERRLQKSQKIILEEENLPDVKRAIDQGLASLFKIIRPDASMEISRSVTRIAESSAEVYQHRVKASLDKMYDDFQNHLTENAGGVILWVNTVLSALENWAAAHPAYRPKQLWAELKRLPPDVEDLYVDMVKSLSNASIETTQIARRALMWVNVATANRPFLLQELREALQIPENLEDIDEDEYPFAVLTGVDTAPSFYRYIQQICGPFIDLVRSKDLDLGEEVHISYTNINWRDQIQLVHQTAKVFLETSEAAGAFQINFNAAQALVKQDSSRYISCTLPKTPRFYSPLPAFSVTYWPTLAQKILTYLEEKALVHFILATFPEVKEEIPVHYQFIFEHTTGPQSDTPDRLASNTYSKEIQKWTAKDLETLQPKVIEFYFRTACEYGWNTAVENLLILASLRFGARKWRWYWEEVPILHGALIIAIRYQLLPQVRKIAWHIEQRGSDILDLPDEVRFEHNQPHVPVVVQEALRAGNFDIAATVIGYRDAAEKILLSKAIETSRRLYPEQQTRETSTPAIGAAREAIETVIGFWKRPSPYDRSDSSINKLIKKMLDSLENENDLNFGPNIGYDLGAESFGMGANINAEASVYTEAQRTMFAAQMNDEQQTSHYNDLLLKPLLYTRESWESYRELCREVAILHGARNKNHVRLAPVDTEGSEFQTAESDKIQ